MCRFVYLLVLAGRLETSGAVDQSAQQPPVLWVLRLVLSLLLLPGAHAVGHTVAKVGTPDDGLYG